MQSNQRSRRPRTLEIERLFDYRVAMMRVDLGRWPYHGQARMWGRASDGQLWALISWQQRISVDGDATTLSYAAWVPADQLSQPPWMERESLRRVRLSEDPTQWPAPARWDGFYVGAWTSGDLLSPPGAEVLTTSAES